MIEPVRTGEDLLAASRRDAGSGVGVWPLGQSGLLLRFSRATVYVDLYLSSHCEAVLPRPFDHRRMSRAPLDASEITDADVVVCSHGHLDHLDMPTLRTLALSSPGAVVVAPLASREVLVDLDWSADRIRSTRGTETVAVAGLEISAFPVPHDEYDEDPALGFPYQGFSISDGSVTVTHVGDARLDDRLIRNLLQQQRPDLLCLPINGRDDTRKALGFAGNMNAEEAWELACATGASQVLPMHFDMFEQNVDVGALERFHAIARTTDGPTVVRPLIGEGVVVRRARHLDAG